MVVSGASVSASKYVPVSMMKYMARKIATSVMSKDISLEKRGTWLACLQLQCDPIEEMEDDL